MALSQQNRLLFFAVIFIGLLGCTSLFSTDKQITIRAEWTYPDGYDPHGCYLDRVTFVVYPAADEQLGLQALQAGIIYAWDERVPQENIAELEAIPGVEVTTEPGDLFRMLCIDCSLFPTNITAYRRALAYALDKGAVIQGSTGGLGFLQDCALPIVLGNWTYEGELTETYYSQNIDKANSTLEAAGFRDLNGNGWRDYDADNSTTLTPGDILDIDFTIEIMHIAGHEPSTHAVTLAVEGLNLCGIMAEAYSCDFTCFLDWLENERDFHIECYTFTNVNSADFLFDVFHSESGNNAWYFGGFNNSEFDAAAEAMMAAPTQEEANDWAWECQRILWYEQPMIVCYNDVYTHAYRTDRWEGYINMAGRNRIGNGYSLIHIRLKENAGGPWGCIPIEYILSMNEGIDTPNVIMSSENYAAMVWQLTYEDLTRLSPYDLTYQPALASHWETEATVASGDIQDGEKYTFHIYPNATWSDGTDVTATDVINSLYAGRQDPREADNYANIYKLVAVDSKTVEIYTNKTGYFEWVRATGFTIVPDTIWNGVNVLDFKPTVEQAMGSGPFKWTAWVPGQYVLLEPNPFWHFSVQRPPRTTCPGCCIDYTPYLVGLTIIFIQIGILGYLLYRQHKSKGKYQNYQKRR
ncbi:MAG: ABC transporter substrate-binding protein [Candidatus Hermodarchaeota archaeon]